MQSEMEINVRKHKSHPHTFSIFPIVAYPKVGFVVNCTFVFFVYLLRLMKGHHPYAGNNKRSEAKRLQGLT